MAQNISDAVRSHNEQALRQIYQPQIASSLSNMRTYVDTRFQEFQQEWLRVVTERAQGYRDSVQESITQIQQVKQQMARAVNMRVSIRNKMKPLRKAIDNLKTEDCANPEIAERLADIGRLVPADGVFVPLADAIDRATSTIDQPMQLAIIGKISSSKSTLVNAILGKDELLPTGRKEVTFNVCWLKYGDPRADVIIHHKDGTPRAPSSSRQTRCVGNNRGR